jgi:hypothetical protein
MAAIDKKTKAIKGIPLQQYCRLQYEDKKVSILEKLKTKIECERCGFMVTKSHIKRHQKTNKCMGFGDILNRKKSPKENVSTDVNDKIESKPKVELDKIIVNIAK